MTMSVYRQQIDWLVWVCITGHMEVIHQWSTHNYTLNIHINQSTLQSWNIIYCLHIIYGLQKAMFTMEGI